jgi:hypothetical protein
MNRAVALLIVNAAVAGLFGLSYAALAVTNRSQRSVTGFGFSYLVGMLTPLAEIAIRYSTITTPFMIVSYGAFLVAFLASSAALSLFDRQRPHWRMIGLLFAFAVIMRAAIWGGPRNNVVYELCYQAPHAAAIALCAWTAWSIARARAASHAGGAVRADHAALPDQAVPCVDARLRRSARLYRQFLCRRLRPGPGSC